MSTSTKSKPIRSLIQIDADLAAATQRRKAHTNDPISTAGNMQAINVLLDERKAATR